MYGISAARPAPRAAANAAAIRLAPAVWFVPGGIWGEIAEAGPNVVVTTLPPTARRRRIARARRGPCRRDPRTRGAPARRQATNRRDRRHRQGASAGRRWRARSRGPGG